MLLLMRSARPLAPPPPPPPETSSVVQAMLGLSLDAIRGDTRTTVGAALVEVTVAETAWGFGIEAIGDVQHQGLGTLSLRAGVSQNGRSQPILTVPAQMQQGHSQVAFMLTPMPTYTLPSETQIRFVFEAQGRTDVLGIEFGARSGEGVIVAVPPVADWAAVPVLDHTEEEGDAEFFDPAAVPSDSGIKSWANLPDLNWDDVPDELTWADADALWAN